MCLFSAKKKSKTNSFLVRWPISGTIPTATRHWRKTSVFFYLLVRTNSSAITRFCDKILLQCLSLDYLCFWVYLKFCGQNRVSLFRDMNGIIKSCTVYTGLIWYKKSFDPLSLMQNSYLNSTFYDKASLISHLTCSDPAAHIQTLMSKLALMVPFHWQYWLYSTLSDAMLRYATHFRSRYFCGGPCPLQKMSSRMVCETADIMAYEHTYTYTHSHTHSLS